MKSLWLLTRTLLFAYGECVLNGGFTAVKMDNVKMDKTISQIFKNGLMRIFQAASRFLMQSHQI